MGEILLMQCPIAGFQFHFGERCWVHMREGDRLALRREPGNRHDPRAVRVEWNGEMLGYLPRESNYAVAQLMDRGKAIEARISGLRLNTDPWSRVMVDVVMVEGERDERDPLLVRSLANRIFGAPASDAQVNWTLEYAGPLALVGIEHPALLPFFRLFTQLDTLMIGTDAAGALRGLLETLRLEPGAWKRLEKWGYPAFRLFAYQKPAPGGYHVTAFANLLFRLDVQPAPLPLFCRLAGQVANYKGRFEPRVFDSIEWFMRALLRECEAAGTQERAQQLEDELANALEWLDMADPKPDANQQHAGWPWIMEKANRTVELLRTIWWKVPIGETVHGSYRVVPITNVSDLLAEAHAMKNCLHNYVTQCASGRLIVFSIRRRLLGVRVACFAAEQVGTKAYRMWKLVQVVGKGNASVSPEIEAVARAVVAKLR